jgi:hypothetical protein
MVCWRTAPDSALIGRQRGSPTITNELDSHGKGHLDAYLMPFVREAVTEGPGDHNRSGTRP